MFLRPRKEKKHRSLLLDVPRLLTWQTGQQSCCLLTKKTKNQMIKKKQLDKDHVWRWYQNYCCGSLRDQYVSDGNDKSGGGICIWSFKERQDWGDLVSTLMKVIYMVMDLGEFPKLKIQIESRRGLGWSSQVSPSTHEGSSWEGGWVGRESRRASLVSQQLREDALNSAER